LSRDENDDDDLLSSGQVSPVEGLRNPFSLTPLISANLPTTPDQSPEIPFQITDCVGTSPRKRETKAYNFKDNDLEYEKKVLDFARRRPWANRPGLSATRVSSWSDPISAKEDAGGTEQTLQDIRNNLAALTRVDDAGLQSRLEFSLARPKRRSEEDLQR
jgi:hypothetical protein